jgi:hypothetical protein
MNGLAADSQDQAPLPPSPVAKFAGLGLLLMEAIANPPAYDRARAAVRHDDVARTLLRAGAAHVDVLVCARVVAPMRATI